MADNPNANGCKKIKDAVCIDTKRIYDSCVSKDCLEDLRVTFYGMNQKLIDDANTIKCRDCCIKAVSIDVDEVPFNKGFYSVDVHFYFVLKFDCYTVPCSMPMVAVGFASFSKRCILYGSQGNVKIFASEICDRKGDCPEAPQYASPTAKVQAVDPIVLSCDVVKKCDCRIPICSCFPKRMIEQYSDGTMPPQSEKAVLVTLGLFSIIQMERDVQMTVPAYDFCIPEKECSCSTQDPCAAFQGIDFPVEQFFPPEKTDACPSMCDQESEE